MSLRSQAVSHGEWERDANGKRFRRVGNSIEYEMMIHTSGGAMIPESELEDFNRRQREERERRAAEAAAALKAPAAKITFCPLALIRGGYSDKCAKEECALYAGGKCNLSQGDAARETAGLRCPFDASGRKCFRECEIYKDGCTFCGQR